MRHIIRSLALGGSLLACSQSLELEPPEADGGPDAADVGALDGAAPDGAPVDFQARPDAAPPGCTDQDGDGYGEGCAAGPDCDDTQPLAWAGAEERCDGVDNDCNGQTDERWPSLGDGCEVGLGACASPGVFACAGSGAGVFCDAQVGGGGDERCNSRDDDCDGVVDEDVAGCCDVGQVRPCGVAVGACTEGEQVCNPDRVWEGCSGQGPRAEACEGTDEDCDGRTDEGVTNACGGCGPVPPEACNGADDDCDGRTDEGVANACGACGPLPGEVCNGQDDDCDNRTDEGVTNACGGCGRVPAEVCNGDDDDCDGQVDEGACRAYLLPPGQDRWVQPPGLNQGGPFAADPRTPIDAALSLVEGGGRVWAFSGGTVWIYDPARDRWLGDFPLASLTGAVRSVRSAWAVPVWWGRRFQETDQASVSLQEGGEVQILRVNPLNRATEEGRRAVLAEGWADDPNAPPPLGIRAFRIDLRNARGWEDRAPGDLCENGQMNPAGPHGTHLAGDRYYGGDLGYCFRFWASRPQGQWPGFALPGAPTPADVTAWTHLEPEAEGQGLDVVFVR